MKVRQSETEHPNREMLLAWLDGEVGLWRRRMIARHLDRCWQCRTAAAETEATIRAVQERERTLSTVDRASLGKAKWRFRENAASLQAARPSRSKRRLLLISAAVAALALFVVFAGLLTTNRNQPNPAAIDALALLHEVAGAEIGSFDTTVRQDRFVVEIVAGGERAGVRREWQVWTAPAARLYATRWRKASGQLQHAVYASGDSMASVYSDANGLTEVKLPDARTHVPLVKAVAASGGEAAALERDFIDWLFRQTWKPVLLAREISEFASLDGAVLRISRTGGVIRWVAEASIEGRRLRMTMEAESESRPPRLVELAWLGGSEVRVLRIRRVERLEYANAAAAAAFFRPDRGLAGHRAQAVMAEQAELRTLPEPGLLEAEVEALSVIHRARLCLGDYLHVDRVDRSIVVTGYSASEERRDELLALFSGIAKREYVRMDLKVTPSLPESTVASGTTTLDEKPARVHQAVAEGWLRRQLRVGEATAEREMFDRMNDLVRGADEVAAESWALRRLAESFPPEREAKLTETLRTQVRAMAEDHTLAMWNQLSLLEPLLPRPAGERRPTDVVEPERSWQQRAVLLQKRAAVTSAMILQLFSSSEGSQATSGTPAQQVLDQIAELPGLIDGLRRASLALRLEFGAEGSAARNQ
jgi:hypothetical protein